MPTRNLFVVLVWIKYSANTAKYNYHNYSLKSWKAYPPPLPHHPIASDFKFILMIIVFSHMDGTDFLRQSIRIYIPYEVKVRPTTHDITRHDGASPEYASYQTPIFKWSFVVLHQATCLEIESRRACKRKFTDLTSSCKLHVSNIRLCFFCGCNHYIQAEKQSNSFTWIRRWNTWTLCQDTKDHTVLYMSSYICGNIGTERTNNNLFYNGKKPGVIFIQ